MRVFIATVQCWVVFLFIYVWMMISSQYASANEVIANGREVVWQHCTSGHVVPDMNLYGGIGSTPSFGAMTWLPDWEHRFEVFHTLSPHPALVKISGLSEQRVPSLPAFVAEIELQIDDIEAILAFVRTLEKPNQ